jgi:hypothetical protein
MKRMDIEDMKQQSKIDMEVAKANAHFIKELAEECYILRIIINDFKEAAGPYAEPYIDAQLEGILGVYRKEQEKKGAED